LIRYLVPAAGALAVLAACASIPARPPAAPSTTGSAAKLTGYLQPGDLDGKTIIGPPPAIDSAQGRADRAVFEQTRALEGSPRWKQAQQDNDLWTGGAVRRYSCALGRDIGDKTTPVTARMIHRIELDVRTVGTPPKDFYDRKRPLIGNTAPLCVPREKWMQTNASYPSGHSMAGWAWALTLGEIEPEKASALMTVGREIGRSRIICGVHFVSDVDAGRVLGSAMVARLHADPAYLADLKAAKAELAKAPPPPAGACEPYPVPET
jgi:acid phosphatase (class A)